MNLVDPTTRRPLRRRDLGNGTALWEGGGENGTTVWPEIDGIPFLRLGRGELADRVVGLLREFDVVHARAELLRDQDDFARQAPPSRETAVAISRQPPATFREAMRQLEYGPVAHYFAHRTSTPTFLSGLWLADSCSSALHIGHGCTLIEIACGVGQFLRNAEQYAERCGGDCPIDPVAIGLDVVWSKLWLGRTYLDLASPLICADVCRGAIPLADHAGSATVFCHDAFYFLPDKPHVYAEMKRVGSIVAVGHAHNRLADHGDVAGTPCTVEEYAALTEHGVFEDDAACARAAVACRSEHRRYRKSDVSTLSDAEAVCWTDGVAAPPDQVLEPGGVLAGVGVAPNGRLRLNPLLVERDGELRPDWPEERFAVEYRTADYLTGPIPTDEQIADIEDGSWWERCLDEPGSDYDHAMRDFVRRRTFIDVPERW